MVQSPVDSNADIARALVEAPGNFARLWQTLTMSSICEYPCLGIVVQHFAQARGIDGWHMVILAIFDT